MKRAVIRGRRRLADARRLIQVVCPICDHRHWMPEAVAGFCNRRNTTFAITTAIPLDDAAKKEKTGAGGN